MAFLILFYFSRKDLYVITIMFPSCMIVFNGLNVLVVWKNITTTTTMCAI